MKSKEKMVLTAAFVKSVKKLDNGKQVDKYTDPGRHGLYLEIREPNRTEGKLWKQRYYLNGRVRETGLGSYPDVSLAEAREKAYENHLKMKKGIDPIDERKKARQEMARDNVENTFEAWAVKRHNTLAPGWKNPKHGKQWIGTLENYAFPIIGKMQLADIAPKHIEDVLLQEVDGLTFWFAKAETARRVRQRMEDVMAYAMGHDIIKTNPVTRMSLLMPKQGHKPTPHRAIPHQEVGDAIMTIRNSRCWPKTALCLEWLVLTVTRSGETRNAVWGEINIEDRIWTIPGSRMKASRIHQVPLTGRCIKILEQLQAAYTEGKPKPDDFLFDTNPGKPVSEMTLTKVLKENKIDAVPHGFRTSFRTWVQEETNYPGEVAEVALAHTNPNKVEAAYARSDLLEKRRQMMQDWADYLARTMRQDSNEPIHIS